MRKLMSTPRESSTTATTAGLQGNSRAGIAQESGDDGLSKIQKMVTLPWVARFKIGLHC
jgi:hypothetical protein